MLSTGVYRVTRDVIFSLRRRGGLPDLSTRKLIAQLGCGPGCGVLRGCRAGQLVQRRRAAGWISEFGSLKPILVILCNRQAIERRPRPRSRFLTDVIQHTVAKSHRHDNPPTLYLLNASAMTKPQAVEHLAVDLLSYKVDIAVITETHLKKKHPDRCFNVNGYSLFRRDRVGKRGGGVAVYVNSRLSANTWTGPGDLSDFELLWVHVQAERRDIMIGALNHPPKPLYRTNALLDYLEASVDAMSTTFPTATVVLAGDFNTLDDSEVISRSALNSIVNRPTRGAHNLDRIYVSDACYENVQVVRSTVKSDHQAVIAYTGPRLLPQNKSRQQRTVRLRSPTQNALFLKQASNLKISFLVQLL